MAIGLQNYPNITLPDSDFPSGRIKDDTGINDGTPVDLMTNGDVQETFAKLLRLSSMTPTGSPDSEYNGHQYIEALVNLMNYSVGSDAIKALLGGYTPNTVVILWGVTVSPLPPGTSTITAGAVFYNDKIYRVPADVVTTVGSQTLVYKLGEDENPNYIYLEAGLTNTGLSDYSNSRFTPKHDFQTTSAVLNAAYPSAGGPTQIGADLTSAPGINRNYELLFTWSFNKITTDPEMYMGFYKNGTLIEEFHHVAIPVNGHSQACTIHSCDLDAAPGAVYSVKLRTGGGTNQYDIQNCRFTIKGTPMPV